LGNVFRAAVGWGITGVKKLAFSRRTGVQIPLGCAVSE
jgi:hypothetical protein